VGLSGSEGAHDWQLSARQDNNSQCGNEVNGALGYGYRLLPNWKLSGSLGSSFVAPSFNDLYSSYGGNADLQPQHGVNKDVRLTWADEGRQASLTRYDNRVRNYIQWTENADQSWSVKNLPGVRLDGWTLWGMLSENVSLGRVFANASFDWLDAQDVETKEKLIRRAARSAMLEGGIACGAWTYEASAKASAGAPDSNDVHLAGYTLWGATVRWAVQKNWTLSVRAENLGNHDYQTIQGYNQPLNRYFVTLSYQSK
jgi:vitamin B12 transporter